MKHIPPKYADSYADWIRVGMGAKSAGGDQLIGDWIEWSSQSPKFDGWDSCERKWQSFDDQSKVTIGTLIQLAKESGWSPSNRNGTPAKGPSSQETAPSVQRCQPISVGQLVRSNPSLRPIVVDGILRRGETANIIAASKVGKSFLAGGLAWSVASGTPWLNHNVELGRVLLLDNELHDETLASRLYRIATDSMISYEEHAESIDVVPLRGQNVNVHQLESRVAENRPGDYSLVVLDALYRTLPEGASENDNTAMMAIYNRLDYYARQWDCAIVVVHHASKGDQSGKAQTDVGSGAGSISRAADTHITIRPHEEEGLAVLEAVTRSFKSPQPRSVKFQWPIWSVEALQPRLKAPVSKGAEKQKRDDEEADKEILEFLKGEEFHLPAKIRRSLGMGES
ncbi:MAG: AAA family ATPase [Planctomycetota bacterium]